MMFSVTIPAFKGRFLGEAIASVLAQTYKDWELIIVDDCSPDELGDVVSKFQDARVRYFRNERNCGAENVVDNWNNCLKYAHGNYIICMGDDDRMLPNCLQDLVSLIGKYPDLDVYYSRTQLIDDHSEVLKTLEQRPERESVYEMIWNRWHGGSLCIGDYCFRTDSLKQRGGFYKLPYAWGSDAITAYEAGRKAGVANTSTPGFQFRISSYSISGHFGNIEGKVKAVLQERRWFELFFSTNPQSDHDGELLKELRTMIRCHFVHMLSADIIRGIHAHPLAQIPFWLRRRKKIGLSRIEILKCVVHGLLGK